jgi:hypothetical protein
LFEGWEYNTEINNQAVQTINQSPNRSPIQSVNHLPNQTVNHSIYKPGSDAGHHRSMDSIDAIHVELTAHPLSVQQNELTCISVT